MSKIAPWGCRKKAHNFGTVILVSTRVVAVATVEAYWMRQPSIHQKYVYCAHSHKAITHKWLGVLKPGSIKKKKLEWMSHARILAHTCVRWKRVCFIYTRLKPARSMFITMCVSITFLLFSTITAVQFSDISLYFWIRPYESNISLFAFFLRGNYFRKYNIYIYMCVCVRCMLIECRSNPHAKPIIYIYEHRLMGS